MNDWVMKKKCKGCKGCIHEQCDINKMPCYTCKNFDKFIPEPSDVAMYFFALMIIAAIMNIGVALLYRFR